MSINLYCPVCNKMVEDRGLVYLWERVDERTKGEVEKEYRQLACGHRLFIRDTGKRRGVLRNI